MSHWQASNHGILSAKLNRWRYEEEEKKQRQQRKKQLSDIKIEK